MLEKKRQTSSTIWERKRNKEPVGLNRKSSLSNQYNSKTHKPKIINTQYNFASQYNDILWIQELHSTHSCNICPIHFYVGTVADAIQCFPLRSAASTEINRMALWNGEILHMHENICEDSGSWQLSTITAVTGSSMENGSNDMELNVYCIVLF